MGTRSHAINLIEMVRLADDAIVVVSAGGGFNQRAWSTPRDTTESLGGRDRCELTQHIGLQK